MADTTGNFQDLLQFSGDTLYNLGEEFVIGNSLATTVTQAFSNSAGILAVAAAPTANATVFMPTSGGTLLTNIKVSAGAASNNLSAVTFSNSNGVSFGLNGSTITGSHAINVSAGTTSNNLSAITFSNLNGVSFGLNGSVITASAAGGGGGNVNFSAGTTSNNLSAITFSNSNGVSFGLNGSTITASVPLAGLSGNVIAFNPAVASSGNSVQTWAEVMAFVGLLSTPAVIYPIGACAVPVGTFDMKNAIISGYANGTSELDLADGTVLENVSAFVQSVIVTAVSGTQASLTWNGNVSSGAFSFVMDTSSQLVNNGATGMIEIAVDATCSLSLFNGSILDNASSFGPIFFLSTDANLRINVVGMFALNALSIGFAAGGSAISLIEIVHDGTLTSPLPSIPGFSGLVVNNMVQGQGGPTASLPQGSVVPLNVGTPFWDTDLGQLVIWDGAAWQTVGGGGGGITAINVSAGTTSNNLSAITFSNSNNVSFGLNGSTMTASYALKVNAGTTSNNLSAITFANSNGISFGLNGSTITAGYGGFSNWQNGAPITSFASSRAFVSFQPIVVPYAITVTNILMLASLSQGTSSSASSGGYNISFGLYTLAGGTSGTFNSASSASSFVSWTSGNAYSSISAVGYRAFSVPSWALTPGPYMFAVAVNSTVLSSIALSFWATASLISIGASGFGTLFSTMPWLPGVSVSSVAALPASYAVSNTASVVRTGGSVNNQPWISFMGV